MRNKTAFRVVTDRDRQRFAKFLLRDERTGCLLFTGGKQAGGHGQFWLSGKMEKAHRVAWWSAGREIPLDWELTHHCPAGDQPNCCELEHLKALPLPEHRRDRSRKRQEHRSQRGHSFGACPKGSRFQSQARVGGRMRNFGYYATAERASRIARFVRDIDLGLRFLMD